MNLNGSLELFLRSISTIDIILFFFLQNLFLKKKNKYFVLCSPLFGASLLSHAHMTLQPLSRFIGPSVSWLEHQKTRDCLVNLVIHEPKPHIHVMYFSLIVSLASMFLCNHDCRGNTEHAIVGLLGSLSLLFFSLQFYKNAFGH